MTPLATSVYVLTSANVFASSTAARPESVQNLVPSEPLAGVQPAPLAAAFLGYRLSFFILPLAIAAIALAGDTFRQRRSR